MTTRLDGGHQQLDLGPKYRLRAPGFVGTAEVHAAGSTVRSSAPAAFPATLAAALDNESITELDSIVLSLATEASPAMSTSRLRSSSGEAAVELEMNDLGPDVGQVVLAVDDSGVATWHYPDPGSPTGTQRFVLRSPDPTVPEPGATTRGILGVGMRLVRTFVYSVSDPVVGALGAKSAGLWERARRPYRLRPFTPQNHSTNTDAELSSDDLRRLGSGRALLFVHGTFSQAHSGFGTIDPALLARLHQVYEGRVFAFDHPTMSVDPIANAAALFERLPGDVGYDLDIVAHSRGGLLGRVLCGEHPGFDANRSRVAVGKLVMAGTPNRGTDIVTPDHLPNLLDRYTTLLTLMPLGPLGEAIDAVLAVVKMLGHGILDGLDGLSSMDPKGQFIRGFGRAELPESTYYALAANYRPESAGLAAWLRNEALDSVFGGEPNDMVVPAPSVEAAPLDLANRFRFEFDEGVHHSGYFSAPRTTGLLAQILTG